MRKIYRKIILLLCIVLLGCATHKTEKMQEIRGEKKAEIIKEQRLDEMRRRMDYLEKQQKGLLEEEKTLRSETEKQITEIEKLQEIKAIEVPKETSMPVSSVLPARIVVLNGSGMKNASKQLETFLIKKGYTVSLSGNADHSHYIKSVVTYRDKFRKEAVDIAHEIPGWQDVYRMKQERPDADIVIIIGKELANKIQ
jgi:hypothetical protein